MKIIGQQTWDFLTRFKGDVYLDGVTESAQTHVVGIDADGKLYKQDVSSGDITGVDISVGTGLDISQSNTTSGDYSSTISLDLTEVGVDGSNNQLLTDNGNGTISSESDLKFDARTLSVGDLKIYDASTTTTYNGLTYTSYIQFPSFEGFNDIGIGGIIKVEDADGIDEKGAALVLESGDANGTNMKGGDMRFYLGTRTGSGDLADFLFFGSDAGARVAKLNDQQLTIGVNDDSDYTIERQTHSDGVGGKLNIKSGNATAGNGVHNQAGGDLDLYGGKSTGANTGGNINFYSSTRGSSGDAINDSRLFSKLKLGTTTSELYLYENAGATTDDYLKISCATHGVTKLETIDASGFQADFTIDADGDITLDATTGNIYLKNSGGAYTPGSDYEAATKKYVDDSVFKGWHGSTSTIKILPRDFVANDVGRPLMIEDDSIGSNELFLFSFSSSDAFAYVPIPTGFKATAVRIYGSDAGQDFYVYEGDITSKTITDVATGATSINTEKTLDTEVTSDATNYLIVRVTSDGATDEIHGGRVTIAAV
tara:strand:+ start:117 stop:1736 length:1620 start_codon:yes stop_codon:yes gene_type:complete